MEFLHGTQKTALINRSNISNHDSHQNEANWNGRKISVDKMLQVLHTKKNINYVSY